MVAVFAALLATGSAVSDFEWDGSANNDWSNPNSWKDMNGPGGDPNPGDTVILASDSNNFLFDTSIGLISDFVDVDINVVNIGTITFSHGNGVGNRNYDFIAVPGTILLTFADGGGIRNESDEPGLVQTIGVDIKGTGSTLLIDAASGDLKIRGQVDLSNGVQLVVDGAATTTIENEGIVGTGGSLLKQGEGTLIINVNNDYGAGTMLAAGILDVRNNGALGSGGLMVTGASKLRSGSGAPGGTRTIANDVLLQDMLTISLADQGGTETFRLNGDIAGSGGLIMELDDGGDVLRLNGENSYTGGTTLKSGVLVVGSDTAAGTGAITVSGDSGLQAGGDARVLGNAIALGGNLTVSGSNDLTLNGAISGSSGALNMFLDDGGNKLTLSGDNTYTGDTQLTRGTLVLGSDTALGMSTVLLGGNVQMQSNDDAREVDNDFLLNPGLTLTFSGSNSLTLNGEISGGGNLTVDVDDGYLLRLTGDSVYTGPTTINSGELRFDGASLTSSVTANSGGTVSGSGSITGNVLLNSGSTYRVMIDGDALTSDLLDITGTATLNAGSTIVGSLTGGYVRSGQLFDILTATGGITDLGADIVTDSATVTVSLIRDEDFTNGDMTYALELSRALDAYSAAADPGNNRAVARSLDSLIPVADADPASPAGDLLGTLDALDADGYKTACADLSPDRYQANATIWRNETREFVMQQTAYLNEVRMGATGLARSRPGPPPGAMVLANDDPLVLGAAIAQLEPGPRRLIDLDEAPESRWGTYVKAQGIYVDQDTTTNRPGFNADSAGVQVGVDFDFSANLVAGMAVGYLSTDADLDLDGGDIDQDTWRFGPYVTWYHDKWYVDGSATFGFASIDSTRNIPSLGLTASGDYDSYDITGYVGTGYHFELGEGNWHLTPIGSLLYSHLELDDFTETGAGSANLALRDRSDDSLRSRLGVNLSYKAEDLGWQPVVYGYVGWEHEFLDSDDISASFAAGGNPFTIDTGSRDEDSVFVGGGFNLLVYENVSTYFRAEYVSGDDSDATGVAGGVSIAF
ncbi:MAG: autotransporter family protein [Planctomycetota bacterium]